MSIYKAITTYKHSRINMCIYNVIVQLLCKHNPSNTCHSQTIQESKSDTLSLHGTKFYRIPCFLKLSLSSRFHFANYQGLWGNPASPLGSHASGFGAKAVSVHGRRSALFWFGGRLLVFFFLCVLGRNRKRERDREKYRERDRERWIEIERES